MRATTCATRKIAAEAAGPRQPAVVDRRRILRSRRSRTRRRRDERGEREDEQLAVPRAHRTKLHQRTSARDGEQQRGCSTSAGQRLPFPAPCRRTSSSVDSIAAVESGPAAARRLVAGVADVAPGVRRLSVDELEDDDGHVVLAARVVRRARQRLGCVVRVGPRGLDRARGRSRRRGPSRSGRPSRAGRGLPSRSSIGERVDVDLGLRSERTGDHRSVRVDGRLGLGQAAAPHELADERVIRRRAARATPSRKRYARESPTCASVAVSASSSTRATVTVVPIPAAFGSRRRCSKMRAFAVRMMPDDALLAVESRARPPRSPPPRAARRARRPALRPCRRRRRTAAARRRTRPRSGGACAPCRSARLRGRSASSRPRPAGRCGRSGSRRRRCSSRALVTRAPLTKVPLVEPASSTHRPSAAAVERRVAVRDGRVAVEPDRVLGSSADAGRRSVSSIAVPRRSAGLASTTTFAARRSPQRRAARPPRRRGG